MSGGAHCGTDLSTFSFWRKKCYVTVLNRLNYFVFGWLTSMTDGHRKEKRFHKPLWLKAILVNVETYPPVSNWWHSCPGEPVKVKLQTRLFILVFITTFNHVCRCCQQSDLSTGKACVYAILIPWPWRCYHHEFTVQVENSMSRYWVIYPLSDLFTLSRYCHVSRYQCDSLPSSA